MPQNSVAPPPDQHVLDFSKASSDGARLGKRPKFLIICSLWPLFACAALPARALPASSPFEWPVLRTERKSKLCLSTWASWLAKPQPRQVSHVFLLLNNHADVYYGVRPALCAVQSSPVADELLLPLARTGERGFPPLQFITLFFPPGTTRELESSSQVHPLKPQHRLGRIDPVHPLFFGLVVHASSDVEVEKC